MTHRGVFGWKRVKLPMLTHKVNLPILLCVIVVCVHVQRTTHTHAHAHAHAHAHTQDAQAMDAAYTHNEL